ncbi:MAG: hypothetical protein NVS3B24_23430 [Candidatus Dormibacteria bacterium]
MRLISSELALLEVLALDAGGDLRLSDMARAAGVTPSAAQRAVSILIDDGIVERHDGSIPVYRLTEDQLTAPVLDLAMQVTELSAAVTASARANRSIEFVALEADPADVVLASMEISAKRSRAARYLETLGSHKHITVHFLDHDDVRKELLVSASLRKRMQRSTVLHGDVNRSFPDRSRHGRSRGRPLGHPHPDIRLPTRRFMQKLARRNHLESVKLFGSAVRTDFRPDSDVDVLIRYRSGNHPSIQSLTAVEHELEHAFGRDVHLAREETLRPDVESSIRFEAVALV